MPLTVFACLMTIVNSALQCNYERAAKYYTIAMRHIQDYNARVSALIMLVVLSRSEAFLGLTKPM